MKDQSRNVVDTRSSDLPTLGPNPLFPFLGTRAAPVRRALLTFALIAGSVSAQVVAVPSKTGADGIRSSYQTCLDKTDGVTPNMQDCIDAEYEYQDKRLNRVYKSLMDRLDSAERSSLRTEERKWLVNRDKTCVAPTAYGGQAQELVYGDCRLKTTAKRATALEVRAR